MEKINVITMCSGYDSQCLALERLKSHYPQFDYELVAWAEFDPMSKQPVEKQPAVIAHNALFPQYADRNMGDITKCDWSKIKEHIDLLFYSTPCQSISSAGLQHGLKEGSGTRSSIIWNVLDAIDTLKPKYLVLENVKALVSEKFMKDFKDWCNQLEIRGYANFWQILNSKNYGVPQNRERVFLVSVKGYDEMYYFPEPFKLTTRLKDVLEPNVDEKFYLSQKMLEYFGRVNQAEDVKAVGRINKSQDGIVVDAEGISPCHTSGHGNTPKILEGSIGEPKVLQHGHGFVKDSLHDTAPSITSSDYPNNNAVLEPTSCAMRGRNPKDPSDRTKGCPTEQRVEIGSNVANCITTVQKDSMVLEPMAVGYTRDAKGNVVNRHLNEVMGTIKATHKGGSQDVYVAEPQIIQVGNIDKRKDGFSNPQRGRVYSDEGISPTIDTMERGNAEPKIVDTYRIRKLTPRECFRLMGVSDTDIDKIQAAGISNSQQYKMAGNSIVVDVLYHIFRKMFVDKKNESRQLSLFD